jgi:hypothetical protein
MEVKQLKEWPKVSIRGEWRGKTAGGFEYKYGSF